MINNIKDGSVKKIQTETHGEKQTENIHRAIDPRRFINRKQDKAQENHISSHQSENAEK